MFRSDRAADLRRTRRLAVKSGRSAEAPTSRGCSTTTSREPHDSRCEQAPPDKSDRLRLWTRSGLLTDFDVEVSAKRAIARLIGEHEQRRDQLQASVGRLAEEATAGTGPSSAVRLTMKYVPGISLCQWSSGLVRPITTTATALRACLVRIAVRIITRRCTFRREASAQTAGPPISRGPSAAPEGR